MVAISLLFCIVCSTAACGQSHTSESVIKTQEDSTAEDSESTTAVTTSESVSDESSSSEEAESSENITTSADEQYPLGSAAELSGNTVIVTIFASDADYEWDFTSLDDQITRENAKRYIQIATDWIVEQATAYGKDVSFIYSYDDSSDLYYETTFSSSICKDEIGESCEDVWNYIDTDIPAIEELETEYSADNVFYMLYYNTPVDFQITSNTRNHYDDMEYPYEYCSMYLHSYSIEENPASYAHEILHIFGAPDLYASYGSEDNYGITDEYVEYCATAHANEIMYNTYDEETGEPIYDSINNILTDVTAYYIGWIDTLEEQETWNLLPSEHVSTSESTR